MKITGYKIKEAVAAYKRLIKDLDLSPAAVPSSKQPRSEMDDWTGRFSNQDQVTRSSNEFQKNFVIFQLLKKKLVALNLLENVYNDKVKVLDSDTITVAIDEIEYYEDMLSFLNDTLHQINDAERNVQRNKELKYPSSKDELQQPPKYREPLIPKEKIQEAIRSFEVAHTKLKHAYNIAVATEISLDVDERLFDESSWISSNLTANDAELLGVFDFGIINGMSMDVVRIKQIDDALQGRTPIQSNMVQYDQQESFSGNAEDAVDGVPTELLADSSRIYDALLKRDKMSDAEIANTHGITEEQMLQMQKEAKDVVLKIISETKDNEDMSLIDADVKKKVEVIKDVFGDLFEVDSSATQEEK